MKDDPHKWLKRLAGDRYVEPREDSRALPAYMYSRDPADSLDRIRSDRKAQERKLTKSKEGRK